MNFYTYSIAPVRTRRTKRKELALGTEKESGSAAVARSVLIFLSMGLTEGAESLRDNYKPSTKVKEFVTVSGEIFGSLRREYENRFADNSVVLSMKVNNKQKQIELTQLGRDVMMTLDNCGTIMSNTTLTEVYAKMRNDMIKHDDIYGKDLRLTALSSPDPNNRP